MVVIRAVCFVASLIAMSEAAIAESYRLTNNALPYDHQIVVRNSDNAYIPPDTGNGDFRDYLNWLHAGNNPGSARVPPLPPRSPLPAQMR